MEQMSQEVITIIIRDVWSALPNEKLFRICYRKSFLNAIIYRHSSLLLGWQALDTLQQLPQNLARRSCGPKITSTTTQPSPAPVPARLCCLLQEP